MMLHQDGSSHEWVAGRDVGSDRHDGRRDVRDLLGLLRRRGRDDVDLPRRLQAVIAEHGLFCALYADRGSHYWHTPEAGGKVDKEKPTQVGRALAQLGIELIAAYSPEARGRSERMFGTLQDRLPTGAARWPGSPPWRRPTGFSPRSTCPATTLASPGRRKRPARPSCRSPATSRISFAFRRSGVVGNDNTVRYKSRTLQIPADRHRRHYVKAQGAGARIPGRQLGRLPRPETPGTLLGRRRTDRANPNRQGGDEEKSTCKAHRDWVALSATGPG